MCRHIEFRRHAHGTDRTVESGVVVMCGILGFLDRTVDGRCELGATMLTMMNALGCRGPDSAGIAVYERRSDARLRVRVKLGERGECADRAAAVLRIVSSRATVHDRH